MKISKIALHNFRSYELFSTALSPNGNVIVGPNGTGKTNLLEAIYFITRGKSFRGSASEMIKTDTQPVKTSIKASLSSQERRFVLEKPSTRVEKKFTINDKSSKILSANQRIPVVLFEPDELRLISSSPTRRRDFLDGILSRLQPEYQTLINKFNRTLMQRNELLKKIRLEENGNNWHDQLFAWDIKFVQLANSINANRRSFLAKQQAKLESLYSNLADKKTNLGLSYSSSVNKNYEQKLLDILSANHSLDVATGHTSVGPHREDFIISIHNQPAIKVASRGEMRTIMLAFKLLETSLQEEKHQTPPILLLDDVFSELDSTREKLLQETIENYQSVVTTTDIRLAKDNQFIISTKAI